MPQEQKRNFNRQNLREGSGAMQSSTCRPGLSADVGGVRPDSGGVSASTGFILSHVAHKHLPLLFLEKHTCMHKCAHT